MPDLPFDLPPVPAKKKERALKLLKLLDKHWSHAECELKYKTPHELLIATILSAQSTDASVNKVTPALFAAFPKPRDYAASTPTEIEPLIESIGLFRTKARAIHASMTTLVEKFDGKVPKTMDELLQLRGVARKTANVVLGNAYGIQVGIPIDTHMERLAVRLGLVPKGASVLLIERTLMAIFPRKRWCDLSHMLIWHGRYQCKARGACCSDHEICREFGDACECQAKAV
jgi:endonuclease-3